MGKVKKYLTTNREALRWCKYRNASIKFNNKEICEVSLGTKKRIMSSKTLVQCVNLWIHFFNERNIDKNG